MINTRKLRKRLLDYGYTYEKMAAELNLSSNTFGKRMRNVSPMTLNEAEDLMNMLEIPETEFASYFMYREGDAE